MIMKISKTLFKNLTRCKNFSGYYDIYINRTFSNVKVVDNNINMNDLDNIDIASLDENTEILDSMFDEKTGEDLLHVSNAQLEAFQSIYVEVEKLAIEYARSLFGDNIKSSEETKNQQYFEYITEENNYYCYLDGYQEEEDEVNIFEVKSTTSRKFDDLHLTLRTTKNYLGDKKALFIKNKKGIYDFVAYDYLGLEYNNKIITINDVEKAMEKLLDPYSDVGKYIYDVAIEKYIIENSSQNINKKVNYYLIVLNHEYTLENENCKYVIDKNGQSLFKVYNISIIVEKLQTEIAKKKEELEYNLRSLLINRNQIGKCCEYKKTTQCVFFPICWKKLREDGSILEFLNKRFMNKSDKTKSFNVFELANQNIYKIKDAYEYIYENNNYYQYKCIIENSEFIDKERTRWALSQIKYPIYYLDFESYNSPLPRFYGEHPYSQSLFQYSLHIEKEENLCNIEKNHKEYLAPDHLDHRIDLIKSLIKDIDLTNGGTVIVYNENFEKTRLKELAEIFPEYSRKLLNIRSHIFDLCQVLNGKGKMYMGDLLYQKNKKELPTFAFYNNNLHGSFSIKKVLPVFSDLTYSTLDVKNGTEAILTYGILPTLTEKEYQEKYLALRKYCRQDTWAMVEILWNLKKKADF